MYFNSPRSCTVWWVEPKQRGSPTILVTMALSVAFSGSKRTPVLLRLQQSKTLDLAVTVLSLGTNKLVGRGAAWLKRNGLVKYVVPILLANEGFGAYRVYAAGGAIGWW